MVLTSSVQGFDEETGKGVGAQEHIPVHLVWCIRHLMPVGGTPVRGKPEKGDGWQAGTDSIRHFTVAARDLTGIGS